MWEWNRLDAELRRWRWADRRPKLWWRDDDAKVPTIGLRRLITLATRADRPLCLSVVPEGADPTLFEFLLPHFNVRVLQHGCRHRNEAGHPASEFSPDAPGEKVAERLSEGWRALSGFPQFLPVYVPPWNCLTPNVEAALAGLGYTAVSAWGEFARPGRMDAHVDLMRWRPFPHFAGRERVLGKLRRELQLRRRARRWDEPIGLLTHHLAHDEDAWSFLEELLFFKPLELAADWLDGPTLFDIGAKTFAQGVHLPFVGSRANFPYRSGIG